MPTSLGNKLPIGYPRSVKQPGRTIFSRLKRTAATRIVRDRCALWSSDFR